MVGWGDEEDEERIKENMASYEASGPRSGLAGMDQLGAALGRRISMIFSWCCVLKDAGRCAILLDRSSAHPFGWSYTLLLLTHPIDDALNKHFFYILHLLALWGLMVRPNANILCYGFLALTIALYFMVCHYWLVRLLFIFVSSISCISFNSPISSSFSSSSVQS